MGTTVREALDTKTPRVLEVEFGFVGFTTLIIVRGDVDVGSLVLSNARVSVSGRGSERVGFSAEGTLHGVCDHFFNKL